MREPERTSRKLAKRLRRNLTKAEVILWSRLRRHPTLKFRRQHPIGPYVADFACISTRLVIEVDGATHGSEEQITHDRVRDAYMKRAGWKIIRLLNEDIYRRLDNALDTIEWAARSEKR